MHYCDTKFLEINLVKTSEAIVGVATIRSNSKVQYLMQKFESIHDAHTRAYFAFIVSSRWFAFKLDLISFTLMSTASLLAVLFDDQNWFDVDSAILGLALTLELGPTLGLGLAQYENPM